MCGQAPLRVPVSGLSRRGQLGPGGSPPGDFAHTQGLVAMLWTLAGEPVTSLSFEAILSFVRNLVF